MHECVVGLVWLLGWGCWDGVGICGHGLFFGRGE